jgi:glyoxylase-like metal-dependent hydrolase (beta-lactamase superfamily II)
MKVDIIPVTPFQQNCSIIICDETSKAAIVDPGGNLDKILARLEAHNVTAEKILITHAHIDHAGGTADLAEQLSVPIIGPQLEDQFWIDKLSDQSRMFQFPEARPFVPTEWLEDGDKVTVGNIELDVRHCPGHTPGHVVFINHANKLIWCGDVLFKGSIGRTDFPRGDHSQLIDAIKTKLLTLDDDYRFISGHGPISSIGEERHSNPFIQ